MITNFLDNTQGMAEGLSNIQFAILLIVIIAIGMMIVSTQNSSQLPPHTLPSQQLPSQQLPSHLPSHLPSQQLQQPQPRQQEIIVHSGIGLPENPIIPGLIPIATRRPPGGVYDLSYKQIGIVHTQDPNEDTVYRLMGRRYPRDSNRWQYRVLTFSGPIDNYGIPIDLNDGEPMKELYTGDTVNIKGKESLGVFIAEIHDTEPFLFRY